MLVNLFSPTAFVVVLVAFAPPVSTDEPLWCLVHFHPQSKKAFGQRDETRAELMGETMVAADDDHQGE